MAVLEKESYRNACLRTNNLKRLKMQRKLLIAGVVLLGFWLVGASNYPLKEMRGSKKSTANSQVVKFEAFDLLSTENGLDQVLEPKKDQQPKIEHSKDVFRWAKGKVARNQSLSQLMSSKGIPLKTTLKLVKQSRPTYNLNHLRAGQSYSIKLNSDNQLVEFIYRTAENLELNVKREDDEFTSHLIKPDYVVKPVILEGVIQDNLISAILKAGGNYKVAIDLTEVFAWKINFFKDLRAGDSFKVLVEKRFLDKEFVGFGKIKAVTFQSRGENLTAVYFEPEREYGGYYTSNGQPLKKQFLKSPLKYTRISSGFTRRRFHPIYKKHLSHQAVDYVAPRGTPIHAVSDGDVLSVSRNSRSGRHVKLRHRNGYETSYSHLSRYGTGISKGRKVQQGQVIGYVGSTGAATGPHLCFHLRKNGRSINPLTFQSPGGPNLEEKNKETFLVTARKRMRMLDHSESLKSKFS